MSILKSGCIPVGMELFPGRADKVWPYIEKAINECTIYVLIIGKRYGSTDKVRGKSISWTEREFKYAVKQGKNIIIFLPKDQRDLENKEFSPNQKRVVKLINSRRKLNSKDKAIAKVIEDKKRTNQNNKKVRAFISRVQSQKSFLRFWESSDDLSKEVSLEVMSFLKDGKPLGGWVQINQLPSLSLISLNHEIIKLGKDYQRIISVYNEKRSLGGLITKAFPLAEKLCSASDENRTASKMVNQLKSGYDSCMSSGAFKVTPDGKLVVKTDWGGDYALLYALCYVHKNKLYDSNFSRGGFPLRSIINDWKPVWVDTAIYTSLICHDELLINSLVNFPPTDTKSPDYQRSVTLIYRIIQLRSSIGSNIKVAGILDGILSYAPR